MVAKNYRNKPSPTTFNELAVQSYIAHNLNLRVKMPMYEHWYQETDT